MGRLILFVARTAWRARRLSTMLLGAAFAYFFDRNDGAARRARLTAAVRDTVQRFRRAPSAAHYPTDPVESASLPARFRKRGVDLVEHHTTDQGDIVCGRCAQPAAPGSMDREWRLRLEGATDPSAAQTVSGLRCAYCGALGMLVLPYGPQADGVQAEVATTLKTPLTDDLFEALRVAQVRERAARRPLPAP